MAGRPVDEKIVAMKMDNSDFKAKALETTGLFGKLKDSLNNIPGVNLSKVTQSFGEIQSAAGKVNLNGLANNIENISSRFTNLGVMATTALVNISNKAVDAGLNLVKSLTLDPIMDGFREYETKMGSIQTILANTQSKGTTLKDVKDALAELNTYADKTIYSFSDMTRNIGLFTNAGLGLKESTSMIKGFSNAAAASGTNAEQAANAAYQLSQGLSSGYIMTQDWMSLTNAGMGNDNMKRDLIAIGQAMGKLDKSTGTTNKTLTNWKDSLSNDKWLTTDVMSTYLQAMAGDMDEATLMAKGLTKAQADLLLQNAKTGMEAATYVRTWSQMIGTLGESVGSGWATTFELIFGDFDVATKLFTGLTNAIGGIIAIFDNARNSFVKGLADAGVFKGFFDIITNAFDAVSKIFGAIATGISKAFSGTNLGIATGMGKAFEAFAQALVPSEKTLNAITIIFQALFSVVNIIVKVLVGLGKVLLTVVLIPIKLIIFVIGGLIKGILAVAQYVGELVLAFTEGVKTGKNLHSSLGGLKGIFSAIGSVIGKVVQHVSSFGSAIKEAWHILSSGDITKNGPWAKDSDIVGRLLRIRDAVMWYGSAVKEAWNILSTGNVSKNGPWAEDSKIVGKLLRIRQAVSDFGSGLVEAYNILVKGDFTGKGPWEEDSIIVDKLFKIREAVQSFVSGVVEAWNILIKGDFTGKGPWEEDSKIVDKLFKIREAVMSFVSGVVEAWNIIVKGDFTGKGPWEEDSKIVDKLFKIREGVMQLGNMFKKAGEFIAGFWEYLTKKKGDVKPPWENMNFDGWFKSAKSGMQDLGKVFTDVGGAIGQAWGVLVNGVFTKQGPWDKDSTIVKWLYKIRDACKAVGEYISGLDISLKPIADAFNGFFHAIAVGYDWIKGKVMDFANFIKSHMPTGNQLFAGGFIAAMGAIVGLVIKMAWDIYKVFTGWGQIGSAFKETLESVGGAFDSFSKTMKRNSTATILIATAIAVTALALSLKLISTIPVDKVTSTLIAITTILAGLIGGLAIITKYDLSGAGTKAAIQMMAMGIAVMLMASALKKLSDMNPGELTKGIYGLIGIMGALSGAIVLMSKFGGAKTGATALQFLALAGAIMIMVSAVDELGKMKTNVLNQGITALGIIILELGIFFALIKGAKFGIGDALAFIAIARAITTIVDAIKEIGAIKVEVLKQGLVTIGLILLAIAAFAQLTSGTGLLATGVGLLLLAGALNALVIPIFLLGAMPFDKLVQGLFAMTIALVAIAAVSTLMSGTIGGAFAIAIIAASLTLLLVPLTALAAFTWGMLLKSMTGLAAILLIVGGAALLLAPAVVPLLGFGAGLALLGIAMLAAGAGMTLFATGLVTLATMTSAAITAIVSTLGMLIMGLASLIPMAVNFVADLIVQIIQAIAIRIPQIVAIFAQMIVSILTTIANYIPQIVDAATKLITNFLDSLAQNLPKIVDSAAKLMVAFVESLAAAVDQNGPKLITAVMDLLGEILILVVETGVAVIQALFGWIPGVTDATNKIGKTAEDTIRSALKAKEAGKDKGKDFADGLSSKSGDAKSAGDNVSKSAKDGATSADIASIGKGKGVDFVNGLNSQSGGARSGGVNLGNSGKDGAGSVSLHGTGSNFGQGFANGISSAISNVTSAALSLARSAKEKVQHWLDIHSPSRVMRTIGGFFGEGFALGITDMQSTVGNNAKDLATTAKDSLNEFLDGFELPAADSELHFKAIVDYDKLDPSKFGSVAPLTITPDPSLTNGLVASAGSSLRQNGSNTTSNIDKSTTTNQNNYEIKVETKGISTRAELRKLAEQIQTEIKNLNDRTKISRGEEVAF